MYNSFSLPAYLFFFLIFPWEVTNKMFQKISNDVIIIHLKDFAKCLRSTRPGNNKIQNNPCNIVPSIYILNLYYNLGTNFSKAYYYFLFNRQISRWILTFNYWRFIFIKIKCKYLYKIWYKFI